VRAMLVAGLVGIGPSIEFLRYAEAVDLPDPEDLLSDPSSLRLDPRVDLLLASLASVTLAVATECTQDRWEAAWEVLAVACAQDRADVAALAASDLLDLRELGWPAPRSVAAFAPILREAALL